jgi:hypothetical protein
LTTYPQFKGWTLEQLEMGMMEHTGSAMRWVAKNIRRLEK